RLKIWYQQLRWIGARTGIKALALAAANVADGPDSAGVEVGSMPGYPPKADVRADMPFVALCQYGYHPQPVRSSRVANSPRRCSLAK
ncbi:MAG: hypothetical protein WCB78_01780, partial [Pseudolabrys sp.]